MIVRRKPRLTFVALTAAVCFISGSVLFSRIKGTEFHGDESGWIWSAYYYTNLLLKRDFDLQKWECDPCGPWGALNMHVGKWLIGIPLAMDPETRGRTFQRLYNFDKSLQVNVTEGRLPPRDILLRARTSSPIFGVLCCVLVFAIGYVAYNAWVGFMASILLLANEQFVRYATRAMTDIHYNFFLLALCLAVLMLSKIRNKKHAVLFGSLCGVLAGLACSVKVTGILIGGSLFVGVAVLLFRRKKLYIKEIALSFGSFALSALVVIYGLNPYFWISWKDMQGKAVIQELRILSDDFKSGDLRFDGARERYPHVYSVLKFPLMFPRWSRLMDTQTEFRSSGWGDNRFLSIHKRLFLEYASFPFEWIFFMIGILLYIPYFRNRYAVLTVPQNDRSFIPLLYFLINYLFILAFMKLNWGRYYLPTIIADRLMIALGLYALIAQIVILLRRLPRYRAPRHDIPRRK